MTFQVSITHRLARILAFARDPAIIAACNPMHHERDKRTTGFMLSTTTVPCVDQAIERAYQNLEGSEPPSRITGGPRPTQEGRTLTGSEAPGYPLDGLSPPPSARGCPHSDLSVAPQKKYSSETYLTATELLRWNATHSFFYAAPKDISYSRVSDPASFDVDADSGIA